MEQLTRADYIDAVGKYISLSSRNAKYGTNALHIISNQLQQEMPGLKGFSDANALDEYVRMEDENPSIGIILPSAEELQKLL